MKITKIEIHLRTQIRNIIIFLLCLFVLNCIFFVQCKSISEESVDLDAGFLNPPESASPRVWWHWLNGYVTKEGIRADLEWMHRIGISGFHNFECYMDFDRSVHLTKSWQPPMPDEKRLIYMTPHWIDAYRFTTKLADSLGFEIGIHSSPGYTTIGGPWVKPVQAMKKLVWSELRIKGGNPILNVLPEPPSVSGPFQNISRHKYKHYADIAVIAYRTPVTDVPLIELKPKVTSSDGIFDLISLTDGDLARTILLPASKVGEKAWVQFEFEKPELIHALTIASTGAGSQQDYRVLEASNDGKTFYNVVNISASYSVDQQTLAFKSTKAKYFRVTFKNRTSVAKGTKIAEIVLHTVSRVNCFEEKAAYGINRWAIADQALPPTPSINASEAISKVNVMDLTSMMQADGTLNWTPPDGNWVVLRFGYSLTGKQNRPAPPEATGLEVDKLNAGHVKAYFNHYLNMYQDATDGLMGLKGLQYFVVDSYEAGVQNWTENMMDEFKNRRGYDMLPWLPVLTGKIVESAEASDRFLWDFRKVIADLIAENFYDQLATILKEYKMGLYVESHEDGRVYVADGMQVKRLSTIPMGAIWLGKRPHDYPDDTENKADMHESTSVAYHIYNKTVRIADIRESASVAHIYGQNLVAAESMTALGTDGSAWSWSPETLKPTADLALASGLNRFVIHSVVHQPTNDNLPGLTLGKFGLWLNRHETWAEMALPWITYLTRSSYMLQQGRFVADIIYFYGEDNNITSLFWNKLPDIPEGYNYDFVNSDALVNVLAVNNEGEIITPGGMSYRLLVLDPNCKYMSLPVLKKINEMVKTGAVLVGKKPVATPSLSDNQSEFADIVNELWIEERSENTVGKGKVYGGHTILEVLTFLKVSPDFEYTKPKSDTEVLFVHRKLDNKDIYWINNRNDRVEELEATFRTEGKSPELWHPETGKIEEVSFNISNNRTTVILKLEPNDAVFVVFGKNTATSSFTLKQPVEEQLAVIDGSWNVSFQSGRGAPEQLIFKELSSWTENSDPGVKYFSGTATYTKTIQASKSWLTSYKRLWLDLGEVKNLAELFINGKSLGIIWKKPFRVDVAGVLKKGENELEIKVTNLWVNRLIGDQQPGKDQKYTYIAIKPLQEADFPLLPSGLFGPVKIVGVR